MVVLLVMISLWGCWRFIFYGPIHARFNLSRSSSIPKIAVVLFQHNEVDILEHWINFYSALFSPASIIILDNFSTDDRIEPILKTAEMQTNSSFRLIPFAHLIFQKNLYQQD